MGERSRWWSLSTGEELRDEGVCSIGFGKHGHTEIFIAGHGDVSEDSFDDADEDALAAVLRAAGWTVEPPKEKGGEDA